MTNITGVENIKRTKLYKFMTGPGQQLIAAVSSLFIPGDRGDTRPDPRFGEAGLPFGLQTALRAGSYLVTMENRARLLHDDLFPGLNVTACPASFQRATVHGEKDGLILFRGRVGLDGVPIPMADWNTGMPQEHYGPARHVLGAVCYEVNTRDTMPANTKLVAGVISELTEEGTDGMTPALMFSQVKEGVDLSLVLTTIRSLAGSALPAIEELDASHQPI